MYSFSSEFKIDKGIIGVAGQRGNAQNAKH